MLRAPGRKFVELKTRMRNFAECGIDRSIFSSSAKRSRKSPEPRASERRPHANCAKSKRFFEIEKEN